MTVETSYSDPNEAFIDIAYRLILNREVDTSGMSHYKEALASGLHPVELLRALVNSDEYRQQRAAYDYTSDPEIAPFLTPALKELSTKLQACADIDRERYERAWKEIFVERDDLIIGQREYGSAHKRRFWELINAVSILIEGKAAPRILEIGASEFSGLYQRLFPYIKLDILDRPYQADYIGFTEAVCRQITPFEDFYAIDLTDHRQL